MSRFDAAADQLESAVVREFGDDALYDNGQDPAFPVQVIIDRDVEQRSAFDTQLPARRHEIEIRKLYVDKPKRGHRITVGSVVWVLDGMILDDGYVTRHHANES